MKTSLAYAIQVDVLGIKVTSQFGWNLCQEDWPSYTIRHHEFPSQSICGKSIEHPHHYRDSLVEKQRKPRVMTDRSSERERKRRETTVLHQLNRLGVSIDSIDENY